MHIIRMDIDRKNSAEHLQVGTLGCGLNAVYSTASSSSIAMTRFIKGLLFRGHCSNELNHDGEAEAIDGSLQWADATGQVRLMSYSGGSPLLPSRFVHSPLHPSERPIHSDDRDQIRGLGNIFREGDEHDVRWDDLRGDILGMVFCSPLGTVSPEKLWWAASRLGVHSAAKSELDEGYKRLKAEEQELLERLRNSESVDHDRAWWSIERDRIAAELANIQEMNQKASDNASRCCQPCSPVGNERLASLQTEISRIRSLLQESLVNEANSQLNEHRTDSLKANSSSALFNNVSLHNAAFGKTKSVSDRDGNASERQRLQNRIEQLLAEQTSREVDLRNTASVNPGQLAKHWDDSPLRQQVSHAEEMVGRWDRRAQTHRRLAEVQSHLQTRSPYRRTTEGSLIPIAEKNLRELTSGSTRQLPPCAIDASYLNQHENLVNGVGLRGESGYRNEDLDPTLPIENTRQRKLVDLAIRLAIAQAAVPRIGRIPMLLDDSLGGFRGESLEQILHVLSAFSRDGRQLLLSTNDEYIARRVAAHGGTVSRMLEVIQYARPSYILDEQNELDIRPAMEHASLRSTLRDSRLFQIVRADSPDSEIRELNRQLSGLANEQANHSWSIPNGSRLPLQPPLVDRSSDQTSGDKRFFLKIDSPIQDAPGVDSELIRRLNSVGISRVGELLRAPSSKLGSMIRVDSAILEQIQRVAELMCGTPQLRAFDAQVLVGCGITRSDALRSLPAAELVHRVESYLSGDAGQDLVRNATTFEVTKIRDWIAAMRHSNGNRFREEIVPIRSDQSRRVSREASYETRPRIVRSNDVSNERSQAAQFNIAAGSATAARGQRTNSSRQSPTAKSSSAASTSQGKFYLDIDSPVLDAPSIGPRMAERLAPFNLATVGDLVSVNAEDVALQLADRSVSAEMVQQWQNQAMLVCRVPNLRGHDAQLIVGCGITSAEELAASNSTELFNKVIRLASSKHGVRILRGSNAPDQQEVSDWIRWAQNCRAVRAA